MKLPISQKLPVTGYFKYCKHFIPLNMLQILQRHVGCSYDLHNPDGLNGAQNSVLHSRPCNKQLQFSFVLIALLVAVVVVCICLLLWDIVPLCCASWPGTHLALHDFEFLILPPLPLQRWDCSPAAPGQVYSFWGLNPGLHACLTRAPSSSSKQCPHCLSAGTALPPFLIALTYTLPDTLRLLYSICGCWVDHTSFRAEDNSTSHSGT